MMSDETVVKKKKRFPLCVCGRMAAWQVLSFYCRDIQSKSSEFIPVHHSFREIRSLIPVGRTSVRLQTSCGRLELTVTPRTKMNFRYRGKARE